MNIDVSADGSDIQPIPISIANQLSSRRTGKMGPDNQRRRIRILGKDATTRSDSRIVVHIKGSRQAWIMKLNRVMNKVARDHGRCAL